jgi:hypothetical protein
MTEFSAENMPKNKEEWTQLKEADPVKFADLTQVNVDRLFRENKEYKEKNTGLENQKNNLTVELEKYKTQQIPNTEVPPVETPSVVDDTTPKEYSIHNLPKTEEEWKDLMIDDPVKGNDLRTYYNNKIIQDERSFNEAQTASRRTVQGEHPDMYLAELDETGQPRKDDKGNVVLKVDTVSGEPIFNPHSEKGKLWLEIYNENPKIASNPKAPEFLMSAMERRLRVRGEKIVQDANESREQQIQDGQVVTDSVAPPQKVEVKFHSDEEKNWAERAVQRGTYANLEEYVKNRDDKDEGYYEAGRMPSFSKKK